MNSDPELVDSMFGRRSTGAHPFREDSVAVRLQNLTSRKREIQGEIDEKINVKYMVENALDEFRELCNKYHKLQQDHIELQRRHIELQGNFIRTLQTVIERS